MANRSILFEIAGMAVGFVGGDTTGASTAASWATSFVEAVASIPASQGASVDPYDGSFDTTGSSITLTSVYAYLLQRTSDNYTTITADLTKTGTTLTVTSTSAFASSGTLYVGDEAMTYSGKTATTFTGLTRGVLGTDAKAWSSESDPRSGELRRVYDFNPYFEGRKCQIAWYDPAAPASKSRRFTGFVSNPRFAGSGWSIDITNGKKLLEDAEAMGGLYAKGKFAGAYSAKGSGLTPFGAMTLSSNHGALDILLDDPDTPFPTPSDSRLLYLLIDEEIVGYGRQARPLRTGTADAVGTGTYGGYFDSTARFAVGDHISYLNGTDTYHAVITQVTATAPPTYRYYHTNGTNPSVAATVSAPGRQQTSLLYRAQYRSTLAPHDIGAEVRELRALEGDHVDLVLQMLTSTGDGTNGSWDVLPAGWGAGIPVALIDTSAFDAIRDYSDSREFKFDGPVKVNELLATLARVTASRIFWDRTGMLTVNVERDVWPDSAAQQTLTISDIRSDTLPRWSAALSRIYNSWVMRGYSPRGKELLEVVHFEDFESSQRYGKRSLPDLDDPGLVISRNLAKVEIIGRSVLHRFARPCPLLELTLIFDEATALEPGQLVQVTLVHIPTLIGGEGLSATLFEVLEVFPQDESGAIDLVLLQMPSAAATRLVAPVCEVASVSGSDITLKAASTTHYAPTAGHAANIYPLSANARDGTEDIHYFGEADELIIIDASDFASAPTNTHSSSVSAIDYSTRIITLFSTPGTWTIAAGDLVTLGDYATMLSNSPDALSEYAWMASGSPAVLGSDSPHVWGL